jgi:glycosyltransferase involved in cell wall biosynthesis
MDRPFFSVIIATYNRGNLIPRAIKSLVSQTETDWEALVIDDGSTDETFARIQPFLDKYCSIKYSRHIHKGMVAAKNTGIRNSAGQFITFLDSDDEFHPLHLESRKAILEANEEIKFLYGRVKVLGNPYVPDRFDTSKLIHLDQCVVGGNFFIERNTAFELNGFKNIALGSDADLFDRVKNLGIHMMEVILPTYIYHRETRDSITNRLTVRTG